MAFVDFAGWRKHGWDEDKGPSEVEETKTNYYRKRWTDILLNHIHSKEVLRLRCYKNYWKGEITTLAGWDRKYRESDFITHGFYQNFSTPGKKEIKVETSDPMPVSKLTTYFDTVNN